MDEYRECIECWDDGAIWTNEAGYPLCTSCMKELHKDKGEWDE